jgi:hypothetical protein
VSEIIPSSTILIALAMLAFSVLIVSKMGGKIPLSKRLRTLLLVCGGLFFFVGLYVHLSRPPAAKPPSASRNEQSKSAPEPFAFTFNPDRARWGDQVEIRVPFSAETVTVYLNGMPLPKKVSADGRIARITIPSGAKTGYLELERNGMKARAAEPITISP